jgi:drug/metabolite transporter superfamily protein YnfA
MGRRQWVAIWVAIVGLSVLGAYGLIVGLLSVAHGGEGSAAVGGGVALVLALALSMAASLLRKKPPQR